MTEGAVFAASLRTLVQRSARARYAGAILLFLVALAVRVALAPAIASGYGMTVFYPAVILAAYWLGARPAVLTALLSTVAVFGFLAGQPLSIDARGWVSLVFFAITSGLAIYLLSTIRAQLTRLAEANDRTEALVLSQAGLFRDHAERVTNHLQLIAAILEHRAGEETGPDASRLLTNAASRTLLISRMHREFAGDADRTIDFPAFARRLAAASVGGSGRRVEVRGDGVDLPLEHATALGVVLLDRLNASRGLAAVDIGLQGGDVAFGMAVEETLPAAQPTHGLLFLEAVATQLRGRLEIEGDGDLAVIRLTFPAGIQPPAAWSPLEHAVH
ncbi:histidine kinase dimerization/phosphoacceptor domain -containing protein [Brevundimonas sp.]|uniref:histidine kinase dimerization/phosphoacceptor domain -containing protein n=1 Tax=Brevundimonas sp. TaxID=1871086 RepID=UPI0025D5BC72|nr:histidine kinase dimerization/phosphoacceptor domain -containing protein [Brevundimonas sp.]